MDTTGLHLQYIIKGARAILEKESFNEAARAIFDYCCELTRARSGYVALLSEDGAENELLFLEAGGLPCTVSHDLPMPIRGLREIAYRTHKTVYNNDFMKSEWTEFLPEGHVVLDNVLFAPLNIDQQTVGIIGLANKPEEFTEDDARIATVFGELAAVALVNSRNLDRLRDQNASLEKAMKQVKTLHGLLPICMHCKNIRDDKGYWTRVESYLSDHSDLEFSHGVCPDCIRKHYPQEAKYILDDNESA